jgi:hypothetical protein
VKATPHPQDLEAQAKRLSKTTCAALGFADFDKLSAADKILVDRAAMLRLLVDDMRMAQLRGAPINVDAFTAASEALEATLRRRADAQAAHDKPSQAKAKFEALINRYVNEAARVENETITRLRSENAELKSEVEALRSKLSAPPPPLPNPLPPNVVPLSAEEKAARANAKPPPSHYLKSPAPQPWRSSVTPSGEITAGPRMTSKDWGPI